MSGPFIMLALPVNAPGADSPAPLGVQIMGAPRYWTAHDFDAWSLHRDQAALIPMMESPSAIKAEIAAQRLQPGFLCGFVRIKS